MLRSERKDTKDDKPRRRQFENGRVRWNPGQYGSNRYHLGRTSLEELRFLSFNSRERLQIVLAVYKVDRNILMFSHASISSVCCASYLFTGSLTSYCCAYEYKMFVELFLMTGTIVGEY